MATLWYRLKTQEEIYGAGFKICGKNSPSSSSSLPTSSSSHHWLVVVIGWLQTRLVTFAYLGWKPGSSSFQHSESRPSNLGRDHSSPGQTTADVLQTWDFAFVTDTWASIPSGRLSAAAVDFSLGSHRANRRRVRYGNSVYPADWTRTFIRHLTGFTCNPAGCLANLLAWNVWYGIGLSPAGPIMRLVILGYIVPVLLVDQIDIQTFADNFADD